ncbi:MAG: deaminase [Candidatus Woesearchaeota archaeon]
MANAIAYPYIPEGRTILYVPASHKYMAALRKYASIMSLDREHPTAAFVVRGGEIIGRGANGSKYHEQYGCERKRLNMPTGQGYELCEGCHPKNHSESRAIAYAKEAGHNPENADIYIWGHWWICEQCWGSILEARINDVFLMEGSEMLFNNKHPGNIIGKFDI